MPPLSSRPGIVDVEVFAGLHTDPAAPPDVLLECPHGATRRHHYDAVRQRLQSPLPADLEAFFFVNTDIGSHEVAVRMARLLAEPSREPALAALLRDRPLALRPRKVVVVRALFPRTFIDPNRATGMDTAALNSGGLTGLLPEYVTDEADRAWLLDLHRQYHEVAGQAYAQVCQAGGLALTLHSYAPKSVDITRIDAGIVQALRAAYQPEAYARWPERPVVDVIARTPQGETLAPEPLLDEVFAQLRQVGIEAANSATYTLHPGTMGERYARLHPGRVLCVELRRDHLAEPFDPFAEMHIAADKVERLAVPLAAAVARCQ